MKILIADDEKDIRNLIKLYLANEDYEIIEAENGCEALKLVDYDTDLVLLDIMMPVLDGIDTCLKIREKYNMPILFLTAKAEDADKLIGFSSGADDYILKPFNPIDLSARIKANIRRHKSYSAFSQALEDKIVIGDITVDFSSHAAYKNSKPLNLTKTEFAIFSLFLKNRGRVFSLEQIYEKVWDSDCILNSESTVSVHIRNLREKIEDNLSRPRYIKTVWGVGYRVY